MIRSVSPPRARQRRDGDGPEQLILPPTPIAKPKRPAPAIALEQAAKNYIARGGKPSVVPAQRPSHPRGEELGGRGDGVTGG